MAQERPNVVDSKPLNYKKWDDMEYESDEDDCHPNIEIGTWRRMKERMRREKGIKKKEPELHDKWNITQTNKKYHIDPTKPPKTSEEQQKEKEKEAKEKIEEPSADAPTADAPTQSSTITTTENKSNESDKTENKNDSNSEKPATTTSTTTTDNENNTKQNDNTSQQKPNVEQKEAKKEKEKEKEKEVVNEDDLYAARSNPQTYLDENLEKLRKFANIKRDTKADKFIKKNPNIVHEASEGFLITHAVDRAVEGAQKPELRRLARRCLMIHNLVQSCSQQNVAPEIGVKRFYQKVGRDTKITEAYMVELNKQCDELMERIEQRRVERLAELQDIGDYDEDEKAPVGPGGLDPTEVLNSLPKEMQDAFINQDIETLKQCLQKLPKEEAELHMQRCIDSGLWVQPVDEDGNDQNE